MLNPTRGRAERGNREDMAPAPREQQAPMPTRGLVNLGRQIRDGEQSRVSNPAHSKRGRGGGEVRVQLVSIGIQGHARQAGDQAAEFQEQAAIVTPKHESRRAQ